MQTRRVAKIVLTLLLALAGGLIVVQPPETEVPELLAVNRSTRGTEPLPTVMAPLPSRSFMELMFSGRR